MDLQLFIRWRRPDDQFAVAFTVHRQRLQMEKQSIHKKFAVLVLLRLRSGLVDNPLAFFLLQVPLGNQLPDGAPDASLVILIDTEVLSDLLLILAFRFDSAQKVEDPDPTFHVQPALPISQPRLGMLLENQHFIARVTVTNLDDGARGNQMLCVRSIDRFARHGDHFADEPIWRSFEHHAAEFVTFALIFALIFRQTGAERPAPAQ